MQTMARVISVGLMICGVLISACAGECKPESKITAAECRKFTQEFYDWYSVQAAKTPPISIEKTVKYKNGLFGPELTKLLLEDSKAQNAVNGEIVGLDFDPFLSTNAEPAEAYTAGPVTKRGESFRIPIFATYSGKKQVKPIAVSEVTQSNGRKVFANFHYVDSSPENENLIAILKALAKERQSHK
ncbi:MAG: YbjP/YqhG family protein [Candidatus Obscuribacterales bacterium]|nr:YbjP/YqhG family protein [Candidatus Obscuribacterales bacterium]